MYAFIAKSLYKHNLQNTYSNGAFLKIYNMYIFFRCNYMKEFTNEFTNKLQILCICE